MQKVVTVALCDLLITVGDLEEDTLSSYDLFKFVCTQEKVV